LDGCDPWDRYHHPDLPIRAILKDFVTDAIPFLPAQVPEMWEDLEEFHKLGILVRDIHILNYMGGKLIDFSRSWTTPHPSFTSAAMHPAALEMERLRDPHDLHRAVVEWAVSNRWGWNSVAIPNEMTDCASGIGQNDRYGTDPRRYDWPKWEKRPAIAILYYERWIFDEG
jgi:hypothetical protein